MKKFFERRMKMTKTLKRLSVIFALIMTFCSVAFPLQAAESDGISPLFINIETAASGIRISGIKATCSATLTSDSSMSLKIVMEIQKKKSSGYSTVKTWTSSRTGTILSISESRTINILYDYRLKTTFTAGGETHVQYAYPS